MVHRAGVVVVVPAAVSRPSRASKPGSLQVQSRQLLDSEIIELVKELGRRKQPTYR